MKVGRPYKGTMESRREVLISNYGWLIDDIAKSESVSMKELMGSTRTAYLTRVRARVCRALVRQDLNCSDIGILLKRDRTTIGYLLGRTRKGAYYADKFQRWTD